MAKRMTKAQATKRYLANPDKKSDKFTVYEPAFTNGDMAYGLVKAGKLGYRVSIGSGSRSFNTTPAAARSIAQKIGGGVSPEFEAVCEAADVLNSG